MLLSRAAARLPRVRARCLLPALPARRYHDLQSKFLSVSEEVRDAVATGKPVVALETTIYTHGMCFVYRDWARMIVNINRLPVP